MTALHHGSCRCGRVTIAVRGGPVITMACHCRGCQRMTASAFSLSGLWHQGDVTLGGETVPGGVQGDLDHRCCAFCHSWVWTRAAFLGPMINIRTPMIKGAADAPPFIECCTDDRLPWATTGAVHSFAGFPPEDGFAALMAAFAART